jgi:hypothetical protein
MKNIFKITAVLLLSISIFSCSSENNSIADEQNSEEQAIVAFEQQINKIKTTLNNDKLSSKGETQVAVTFDIRMKGTNYIIENIKYLNEFEYGFAQGFSSESKQLNNLSKWSSGGGMRQANCVGKAVKACLDGGGCAEVCKMQATIEK